MAGQIMFFNKNKLDVSNTNAVLTATEANDYVNFVRNRNNDSAWVTTGSADASLTEFEVDFVDQRDIDTVILIKHNFKAYTVQYWNGTTYVNFSTPILESANTKPTTQHYFTEVTTTKIKLVIQATMVANSEKRLTQFIATTRIGQFQGYPEIDNPEIDRNRKRAVMLSGKNALNENVGGFSCRLKYKYLLSANDEAIVETLFDANEGFLVWICGGDEDQFASKRKGFRLEDLPLMKCANEYSPERYKSMYRAGLVLTLDLVEVGE